MVYLLVASTIEISNFLDRFQHRNANGMKCFFAANVLPEVLSFRDDAALKHLFSLDVLASRHFSHNSRLLLCPCDS